MLNDFQINRTWEGMLSAETRALYFADLASKYTRRKQIITGCSFFFSSGAAASAIGKLAAWVPILLALLSAVSSAYSIAVGHSIWGRISPDYERSWNHAYDDDAESQLDAITQREMEPSELAATGHGV